MKGFTLILIIVTRIGYAGGLGPSSPASLLPPLNAPAEGPLTAKPPHAKPSPEFDPIFDLNDPSTLLEQEERALSPDSVTNNVAVDKTQKLSDKPTPLSAYDKKLMEVSQKLLGPRDAKIRPLPPLDSNRRMIPLIPPIPPGKDTAQLENATPPPFYAPAPPQEPPHPPLLSAMNPPPKQKPYEYPGFDLMPMMAGMGAPLPSQERQPTSEQPVPAHVTPLLPVPKTTALVAMPGVPDVAIILSNNQFFPSKIRLKEGTQTRLIFTTTNKKPAALIMEKLKIQRWIAKEKEPVPASELDRAKWEVNRELSASRVTEVVLDPKEGTYTFHDAISGASGEIEVEKK